MILNRYEVGNDGRTAYECNKNKKSKMMGLEFGEAVLWRRRPVGDNLAKLAILWEHGVYLGVKATTGEIIVGNAEGVWRARTVRRRPVEERWSAEAVEKIKGVQEKAGEKKEDDVMHPGGDFERLPERMPEDEEKRAKEEIVVPRAFHTKREDYERHGYTRGCPGCRALLTGTTRQKHSAQCRTRMENEMKDDDRVKAAKGRRDEFFDKVAVPAVRENGVPEKKPDDVRMKDAEADQPASGSGLSPEERKRGIEESWSELAERIKRRATADRSDESSKNDRKEGADGDHMEIGVLHPVGKCIDAKRQKCIDAKMQKCIGAKRQKCIDYDATKCTQISVNIES